MQKNNKIALRMNHYMRYWFIGMCAAGSLYVSAAHLSFNTLFPMTWYERSLNTTIFVWHKVGDFFNDEKDVLPEVFERVIDRCAFAYFCLEKMIQSKQEVIEEDIVYLVSLLYKLENRLANHATTRVNQSQVALLMSIVAKMQQSLELPCNI